MGVYWCERKSSSAIGKKWERYCLQAPAPGQFSILGGRGSDRFGRKRIGFICFSLAPIFAFLYYVGPSWALPMGWAFYVACTGASDVILRSLAVELFPTSSRGTAAGWMMLFQSLGWSAGLWAIGVGSESAADLGPMIAGISLVMLIGALSILLLPETHGKELEAISDGG